MDPKISEVLQKLQMGEINRRDFIRAAGLLGLSVGAAEILSACAPDSTQIDPNKAQIQYEGYKTVPTSPHTFLTPEATNTPLPQPKLYTWYCQACGQRFSKMEELQSHLMEVHSRLLPEVKRVDKPTFTDYLVDVKRFDEKNTIFSRIAWDEEYQQRVGKVMPFVTPRSVRLPVTV